MGERKSLLPVYSLHTLLRPAASCGVWEYLGVPLGTYRITAMRKPLQILQKAWIS